MYIFSQFKDMSDDEFALFMLKDTARPRIVHTNVYDVSWGYHFSRNEFDRVMYTSKARNWCANIHVELWNNEVSQAKGVPNSTRFQLFSDLEWQYYDLL